VHVSEGSKPAPEEYKEELKSKEEQLEAERQEKEHLAKLISELEKKVVHGGTALEDREREQVQKQRQLQLQLRKQRKREKELQS